MSYTFSQYQELSLIRISVDRLGEEGLFAALEGDDLLSRKDTILSAPLLQKP